MLPVPAPPPQPSPNSSSAIQKRPPLRVLINSVARPQSVAAARRIPRTAISCRGWASCGGVGGTRPRGINALAKEGRLSPAEGEAAFPPLKERYPSPTRGGDRALPREGRPPWQEAECLPASELPSPLWASMPPCRGWSASKERAPASPRAAWVPLQENVDFQQEIN